jgi:TonB family protein
MAPLAPEQPSCYTAAMRGLYLAFALFSVRAAAQTAEYSAEARLAGLEGTVQVTGMIAEDGTPHDLRVTQSLGLGLDQKALEAVALRRFAPGSHTDAIMPVSVDFLLSDKRSRWHLTRVNFELSEGASRPVFLGVGYPLGSGIVRGADDTAIDEARIVAAVGRQAWAVVSFDVDENGVPRNFEVPEASVEIWKNQAVALVRDWRFTPGRKDGKPVAVRCTLALVWGDRNLSASQLAKARVEDMPVPRPPPTPFEFPPTPGVARIQLQPSEAAERLQSIIPEGSGALGVLIFSVLIGTDGHVRQAVAMDRASPYVRQATQILMQWIYRPAMLNGSPAEMTTVVPVLIPEK